MRFSLNTHEFHVDVYRFRNTVIFEIVKYVKSFICTVFYWVIINPISTVGVRRNNNKQLKTSIFLYRNFCGSDNGEKKWKAALPRYRRVTSDLKRSKRRWKVVVVGDRRTRYGRPRERHFSAYCVAIAVCLHAVSASSSRTVAWKKYPCPRPFGIGGKIYTEIV